MNRILLTFICAFFVGMIVAPPLIALIKKLKAKQTILSYVEQHKSKDGVPTMGGVIFILAAVICCFIFWTGENRLAFTALMVTLCYGVIGGLDDVIKVIFKRNLGLKAYQKIISQSVIAILATIYAYQNFYVGASIEIPVFNTVLNLKWFYIPLGFTVFIATTNCVNLTDGLDGLAGGTVGIYLAVFFAALFLSYNDAKDLGQTFYAQELYNLLIFIAALVGGLAAFLWFNSHRAKIFMGDTGSLALGGACAIIPLYLKNPLMILIVGIMFVASGISVIVQVVSFKLRKKRVFLMAPLHHHLEMKGFNESKIVSCYCLITAVAGAVALIIM